MSEEQHNSVSSVAGFPAVYQEDIGRWLTEGNSIYNLRLMSGGADEFLIGWSEANILILQSDRQQIINKWALDGEKDYELNLLCDPRYCTLSATWSEHKEARNISLSVGAGDASGLLPVIDILLHQLPYRADIIQDDETTGALLRDADLQKEYREFAHCFCDSALDSYWDKKKSLFQNGPVVDYFFGVSIDAIVVSAYRGKAVQLFYFPWKTVSDISYKAGKIRIKTNSKNLYLVPVSLRKRKEAKKISDSYSYLTHLF